MDRSYLVDIDMPLADNRLVFPGDAKHFLPPKTVSPGVVLWMLAYIYLLLHVSGKSDIHFNMPFVWVNTMMYSTVGGVWVSP